MNCYNASEGLPYPLGATADKQGVNFAIFSANAQRVELCLFDPEGCREIQRINLAVCTDQVWHVYVEGLTAGAIYGYRVYGPYEPQNGHRFNPHKLLIDPYAKQLFGTFHWSNTMLGYTANEDNEDQDLIIDERDNAAEMVKCVVVDNDALLVKNALSPPKPNIPWNKTIIYELHVKGFSKLNMALAESERGFFSSLAQPEVLSYIKQLGVTAIELLPVHVYIDEKFLIDNKLTNYWGYNSLNFFTVHHAYLKNNDILEFKQFIDAAHAVELEVILDVVYNHTAEGNRLGPTLSFRGIDNASYYGLEAHDARFYINDTGCGNTLNAKHPRVLQMVMDSLRYWAELGVDGFRFDLATVLGRETGGFDPGSGFFDAIRQDPILASCKMIAEPWDIGPGGYQVGNYPSGWSEWNDRYRDIVRCFWRGDAEVLPEFARRIHGSSDLFEHLGRAPSATINFISSHDGFTLNDLVSYNERNNYANNENNNDGHHSNFSYNHGEEGESNNAEIIELRDRQKRNFIATLFLSQGTPMLLAGDELGRTQQGNNNAYCQDNNINWIAWKNIADNDRYLQLFTRYVISLRQQYPLFTSKAYIHRPKELEDENISRVHWYNPEGCEMSEQQWQEADRHTLTWVLENSSITNNSTVEKSILLLLFNAGNEPEEFYLPQDMNVKKWTPLLDTCEIDGVPKNTISLTENAIVMKHKSMQVLSANFE